MGTNDKIIAGLVLMNVIIGFLVQTAAYIGLRWARNRRRQCGRVIARGHGHLAVCVLSPEHIGDHATTKAAFETVGYHQTPF